MTPGSVEVEALPEAISLPPGFGLKVTESAKSSLWLWQRFLSGWFGKAPSSKPQAPNKLQVSNPKSGAARFGAWCLELLWDLELGIWSFVRPRSPPSTRLHPPKAATPQTPSPQSKTLARQLAAHSGHSPKLFDRVARRWLYFSARQ